MSSAEEHFGSSSDDPLEVMLEWDANAFYTGDLLEELWKEEYTTRKGLFDMVYGRLQTLNRNFSSNSYGEWQSFHTIAGMATTRIWIARRMRAANDFVHVLNCTEGTDTIDYSEFVVSSTDMRSNSIHSEARKQPEDDWERPTLGAAALVYLQNGEAKVFRGSQSRLLQPRGFKDLPEGSKKSDEMAVSARMKQEMTELTQLLGKLTGGAFYEEGVTGRLDWL